jgi:hypothetical protein
MAAGGSTSGPLLVVHFAVMLLALFSASCRCRSTGTSSRRVGFLSSGMRN